MNTNVLKTPTGKDVESSVMGRMHSDVHQRHMPTPHPVPWVGPLSYTC